MVTWNLLNADDPYKARKAIGAVGGQPTAGTAGDGSTDDRAALASSDDTALAANLPLMLLPGTYKVSSNLTIDSPVWFTPGAVLKPDNGITVTLAGGIVNAPMSQIFDSSAGGAVVVQRAPEVYPQWWGALGDDTNDDQPAIQAMFDAASAAASSGQRTKVVLPPGVYRCDDELVPKSNICVENQGHLKFYGGDAIGGFVVLRAQQNIELYGGIWDSNQQENDNTIALGFVNPDQSVAGDATENIFIHDMLIKNSKHGGSHIVDIDDPADVGRGGGKGITVQFGNKDITISDVVLENCDLGLSIEGKETDAAYSQGIVIENVVLKNCKYMGLFLTSVVNSANLYGQTTSVSLNNIELVDCGTGQTTELTPQDCADLFGAITCQSMCGVQARNIRVKCTQPGDKLTVFRGAMRSCDWDVQVFCTGTLVDVVNSEPYAGHSPVNITSRWNSVRAHVNHYAAFSGYLLNAHATYYAAHGMYDFAVTWFNSGSLGAVPEAQYANNQQATTWLRVTDLHAGKTVTVFDGTPAAQTSAFAKYVENGLAIDDVSGNDQTKIGPTRTNLALVDASGSTKATVNSSGVEVNSSPLWISSGRGIYWGAGSPEGVVTAEPGSAYLNSSGGTGTTLYAKETGSGNTGWVAK